MSENKLKWRVQHKTGTSAEWALAKNFTPLEGELIIYTDLKKIKFGDGKTNVNDLEFFTKLSAWSDGNGVVTLTNVSAIKESDGVLTIF